MRFRYNMDRTTLPAFAMIWIIVLGLVAERGVEGAARKCRMTSGNRRITDLCKRNKIKKAAAEFEREVSDVQTKR